MTNFLPGISRDCFITTATRPSLGRYPYTGRVRSSVDFERRLRRVRSPDSDHRDTLTQNGLNNQGLPTWGLGYMDRRPRRTQRPGRLKSGRLSNLTGDTHPIHFISVNVQLIQRQPFAGDPSNWSYIGSPTPPAPDEIGWKDTVAHEPGRNNDYDHAIQFAHSTRFHGNPLSPRTGGHEYVWHCHILEHEEHDMMRPLVVT